MPYLLIFENRKEKKKKGKEKDKWPGSFFPGWLCTSGYATLGFLWLLGAIKSCLKGQSLDFMYTLCVGSYLVG
jgi:hypothetical protein